ncbi:MAG: gamma-glutamylcyclotransferase [Nitratireductor sp.]|nr:gamma-glutamylcyclotransferase [Nitratireductor sp.]
MAAGEDRLIAYFGYGSLVNLATLKTSYVDATPAVLKGWRRHWQARPGDGVPERALLSIHRDAGCEIGGMVVIDRASSLPSLDLREMHYERVPVAIGDLAVLDGTAAAMIAELPEQDRFVYVGRPMPPGLPPLLQSYLHTVMDGFLSAHGEAGLAAFLDTTHGFERAMLADADAPFYTRMTAISKARRRRFDDLLVARGVRITQRADFA